LGTRLGRGRQCGVDRLLRGHPAAALPRRLFRGPEGRPRGGKRHLELRATPIERLMSQVSPCNLQDVEGDECRELVEGVCAP
jgi:hypothetical protein